jgi:hypothetical protein
MLRPLPRTVGSFRYARRLPVDTTAPQSVGDTQAIGMCGTRPRDKSSSHNVVLSELEFGSTVASTTQSSRSAVPAAMTGSMLDHSFIISLRFFHSTSLYARTHEHTAIKVKYL